MKTASLSCSASLLLIVSFVECNQSPFADVLNLGATQAHAQEVGAAGAWAGWKFDLNKGLSPTSPGYLGVMGSKLYRDSGPPLDYGWDLAVGEFERPGPSDLLSDGHFHQEPRIFRADLPAPGRYRVRLYLGDELAPHDHMRVTGEGAVRADEISTTAREFAERNFSIDVQDGTLELQFEDVGTGNPDWVINAIEIYSAAGPDLVLSAPAPTLIADGATLDTIKGTAASPGAIITVTTDRGLLLTADVNPQLPGTQVAADARGEFDLKIQRPALPGVTRITASEVAGTQYGETTLAYTAPPPSAQQVFPLRARFATPVTVPPTVPVGAKNPFDEP